MGVLLETDVDLGDMLNTDGGWNWERHRDSRISSSEWEEEESK